MGHESPSMEQKRYAASVCPKYLSRTAALTSRADSAGPVSCERCLHWNNARCTIFDDVLTGIDQT